MHGLPEEERICPECGGALHQCGQSVARRELVYVPAQYKVVELIQLGVPVSRQNMANWVIAAHERWFSDFFQALRRELLSNDILHADETTLMVLQELGRKAQQKSYVWVYRTSGDASRPVVLYDYQPSRAGECASNFLNGFSGFLHTDGYEAYHCKLPSGITAVGCWAHMRRKFTDTLKSLPKEVRDRSRAKKYVWRGADLCRAAGGLADERFSGWAAGVVQQPGRAGCTPLCGGAEELAVFQHAKGRRRQRSGLLYRGNSQSQRSAALPIPQAAFRAPVLWDTY